MDAISGKNVLVAAPSWREIEHVTPVHHPLLIASRQAAHSPATSGDGMRRGGMLGHSLGVFWGKNVPVLHSVHQNAALDGHKAQCLQL